jgi:hypothetical protein
MIWLIIFDDVTELAKLQRYIPRGSGHVIITSRISQWGEVLGSHGIEIKEFARADTVEFLRRRVRALGITPPIRAVTGRPRQAASAQRRRGSPPRQERECRRAP